MGTIMASERGGQECLPKPRTHSQLAVQATTVAPFQGLKENAQSDTALVCFPHLLR